MHCVITTGGPSMTSLTLRFKPKKREGKENRANKIVRCGGVVRFAPGREGRGRGSKEGESVCARREKKGTCVAEFQSLAHT